MRPQLKTSILACLMALVAGLPAPQAFAQTRIGGEISKDTRLTKAESPYVAFKDIHVMPGATLTIEPGVKIQFKAHIKDGEGFNASQLELLVEGKLVAVGAAQDSIGLISAADKPESRDWQGVVVRDGGSMHLENAYIENCIVGISASKASDVVVKHVSIFSCHERGINVVSCSVNLEDLYITNVGNRFGSGIGINVGEGGEIELFNSFIVGAQNGVMLYNDSSAKINYCVISGAVRWGLSIKKSFAEVTNCSITNNDYGIVLISGSNPKIHNNNIFQNGIADVYFRQYDEKLSVDLSNNWWERQDLAEIQRAVLDGTRDPEVRAFALVEPILQEAVVTDPNVK